MSEHIKEIRGLGVLATVPDHRNVDCVKHARDGFFVPPTLGFDSFLDTIEDTEHQPGALAIKKK